MTTRPIRMMFTDKKRLISALKGIDDLQMEIPEGKVNLSYDKKANKWCLKIFDVPININEEQAEQIADTACRVDSSL